MSAHQAAKPMPAATLTWRGYYFGAVASDGRRDVGSFGETSNLDYDAELIIPGTRERQGRWSQQLGTFKTRDEARLAVERAHAERMRCPETYDQKARDAEDDYRARAIAAMAAASADRAAA